MTRRINAAGLALVKQWEDYKLEAYRCVAGIWTIGYGHTSAAGLPKVTAGLKITLAEAERILQADLEVFEVGVEKAVKVPLNDNQFAALVSFSFNVGVGALKSSTLLKKLNEGGYSSVPTELLKWNKARGKVVAGLTNRRRAEGALFSEVSLADKPIKSEKVGKKARRPIKPIT